MSDSAFPLIYEIAGHRRCYLVEPGTELAVGSGADCQIKLEWEGVSELEATLKVVDHSSVNIAVPGQADVAAPLPLTLAVGGHELSFSRPQDMAGWTEPAADNECTLNIGKGGGQSITCKMQSSRPLLIGTDSRCDVVLDSIECPGVVLALWAQGAGSIWVQILDNSAPVDWEARGEALEGATSLPMAASVAGKIVSIKATPDAKNNPAKAQDTQAQRPHPEMAATKTEGGRKPLWPLAVAAGFAAMLLTAGAIHFLNSKKAKLASPLAETQAVATSTAPSRTNTEIQKSPAQTAESIPMPITPALPAPARTPESSANVPATPPVLQPPAQAAKVPTTVAVLEFENIGGGEEAEPLRKGLRAMMVTDLSGVSMLKIVERARLDDLMKELALSEGKFIDQATAQKLGKGLAAQAVLTGSYTVFGNELRLDVKLVRVETGEIIFAEKTSGPKDTFFSIEQELAKKLVAGLNIELGDSQRVALSTPQTKSFAAFNFYSKGLLASSTGDLQRAEIAMRQALSEDRNFKLADQALEELKKRAAANIEQISSTQMTRQKETLSLADQLLEQMAAHAAANRQIASGKHYDSKYFKSLIVLATHAELNGQPNVANEIFQGFVNDLLLHTQPGEFFKLQKAIGGLLNEDRQVFLKTAFAPNPNASNPTIGIHTDSMFPLLRLHEPKLFGQGFWATFAIDGGVSFDLTKLLEEGGFSNIRQSIERRLRLYEFASLHPEHVKLARYNVLNKGFFEGNEYHEFEEIAKSLESKLGEDEFRYFTRLLSYGGSSDAEAVIRAWNNDPQLRDANFLKALVAHVRREVDQYELYIKHYRGKGDEQEARKGERLLKSRSEVLLGLLRCVDNVDAKPLETAQPSRNGTAKTTRHWELKSGREFEGRFEMSDGKRLVVAVKGGEKELFAAGELNQEDLDFVKQCAEAAGTWNNEYHVWDEEFAQDRKYNRFSIGKIMSVKGLDEGDSGDSKKRHIVPQVMVRRPGKWSENVSSGISLKDLSKDDLKYIDDWRRRSNSQ